MEGMDKIEFAYMTELCCVVFIVIIICMGIVAFKLYKELSQEDKDIEE